MINPFLFLFRARDKPRDAVSAATTFSFGTSGSGKPVNAKTAISEGMVAGRSPRRRRCPWV